ncbi:hypothetical protein MLD38_001013 [Melastoma candidum]|uniref:Uncharacterized protein n=1 Tax=Melastoma candidum TaxID=119954 RepID=A0ACB9SBV9_9MYRT|nr:hypothetical protein MLD38_001013 [Melastoma candidum]
MGYFSCNGDAALSVCDCKKISPTAPDSQLMIRKFRYSDVLAATDGFSSSNLLGKGSHGSVYRALLDDGKLLAAVKRATVGSSFGSSPSKNEAGVLSRIRNRRLVNLVGFCDDASDGRLILVVEYMPNGSLHELLHGSAHPPGLARRIRLALQVAKAVRWLHSLEPPVIHRDIKSCNVLIDEKQNARLGDFGLALRGQAGDARATRTPPAGTLGYLDPSYLAPGDLSTKSDVFSFGILLLEILSGRNAIDVNYSPSSVVDWAMPLIRRREFEAVYDNRMEFPVDSLIVRDIALVAAGCVRTTVRKRPEMADVVAALKGISRRVDVMRVLGGLRRRGQGPWPHMKEDDSIVEFASPARYREPEPLSDKLTSPLKKQSPSHEPRRPNLLDSIDGHGFEVMKEVKKLGKASGRNTGKATKLHTGMSRSKSVGSSREWESRKAELAGVGRQKNRRSTAGAKWPAAVARLNKSRSMGEDHRGRDNPYDDHRSRFIGGGVDEADRLLPRPLSFSIDTTN